MKKLIEKNYLGTYTSYDKSVEFLQKREEEFGKYFSRNPDTLESRKFIMELMLEKVIKKPYKNSEFKSKQERLF